MDASNRPGKYKFYYCFKMSNAAFWFSLICYPSCSHQSIQYAPSKAHHLKPSPPLLAPS